MAEGSKVRLVRCPKCDNLLPELPDIPVYQCGGCGTVLQVKIKSTRTDGSSDKSDEERVNLGSQKSDSDREIDGLVEIIQRREREENSSSSSCSRLTENGEIMTENMATTGYVSKYRRSSKAPIEDHNLQMNKEELMKINSHKEIGEMKSQIGIASLSHRSDQIPHNWLDPKRDGLAMNRRTERIIDEGARFATTPNPDEGPSNYKNLGYDYSYGELLSNSGSNSRYGEPVLNPNNSNASERVEYLEQDRAELLRKLQELQDQLNGSCDVSGKPKEKVSFDGRMVPPDPYGGRYSRLPVDPGSIRVPPHPYVPDKHVRRPLYFNQGHDQVPVMNRPDMDLHNFYPPIHPPTEIPGYPDSFGPQIHGRVPNQPPQIHGRVPNQPPHRFPQRPSHDYYHGRYMEFDPDTVSSYRNNTFFHQPACSCYQCYNKHWQVPAQVPPTVLRDRSFPNGPSNHAKNLGTFGSQGYYPGNANPPPLHSRERHPRVQMSTDLDSELGGFGQRPVVAKRSGRRCYPVAGGAPFITCYNCFELLQMPRKFLLMEQKERKLKCGACATIITVLVERKKLVCTKKNSLEVNDGPVEVVQEGHVRSHRHAKWDSTNSYSEDYDNSGYNFQSMDADPVLSNNPCLNLGDSEKMHNIPSTSTCTSEGEESPDSVIARKELSSSSEPTPSKPYTTPSLPGSPLLEHFEYSSYHRMVDKLGNGNKSKRMDQEEVVQTKSTSRQNSLKDASAATEMEVSFNEYSITGASLDSNEATKEEDQSKISKGGVSFFAGLLKKSSRDSSGSNHVEESEVPNVSVNGQPVPNRLVKKAEKRAGRIHPGQYWYDYRAGFWGVMGQPCLGILPPSIEEFNYPMPKNCAGGNTGVLVNGRELHKKDLDLLASRGLPTTKDKSYIIEITGMVVDENTWEELESLGKLAPTIEKLKHGFGMKAPRMAA